MNAKKNETLHPAMDMPHDQKIAHAYGCHDQPQRTWVGLTWDEANEIAIEHDVRPSTVKTIEAKLKEKNT